MREEQSSTARTIPFSKGSRSYDPKSLNEKQRNILRLHSLGLSHIEIAETLGITKERVYQVVSSPLGQAQTSAVRERLDAEVFDAAKRIREILPQALQTVQTIMDDDTVPAAIRLKAAQDILDRGGYAPVRKMDVRSTSVSLSPGDLEDIKRAALERAKDSGILSLGCVESGGAEMEDA